MKNLSYFFLILFTISCSPKEIDISKVLERNNIAYEINSENPYSGKVYSKDSNGQFLLKGVFDKGLKTGLWEEYYSNGQVSRLSNFKNGLLNGMQEIYNREGLLTSKGNYVDDLKNENWKTYYNNGQLKFNGDFSDDEYDGLIQEYYNDGKLKSEIEYNKSTLDGTYKTYNAAGNLNRDYNYSEGELNGVCVDYTNNTKHLSTTYKMGVKHGKFEEWQDSKVKLKEIIYENSLIVKEKYWNFDGTPRPLLRDALSGKWDASYDDGTNIWIRYVNFLKNNKVIVETDRKSNGLNKKWANYDYKMYNKSEERLNIIAFDEFTFNENFQGGKMVIYKVTYLSENKMNIHYKGLREKRIREYRKM